MARKSMMGGDVVFVLNSGSSSLKFGVFAEANGDVRVLFRGAAEGIGTGQGKIWLRGGDGKQLLEETQVFPGQSDVVQAVAKKLSKILRPKFAGIGHRVVHGGASLAAHQIITDEVLRTLELSSSYAPLHGPAAVRLIEETQYLYPDVPQFACFDAAFHQTLPEEAARLPLPKSFWEAGIRKYGFHGLSCESIVHALGLDLPARVIVAHLGNGASVTAIAHGLSVDTTMGLTPTGGIIMGTRTGDLDPGVLLYILKTNGADVEGLEKLVDKRSGLLGISGVSSDMRALHAAAAENPQARLAIEMFARVVKKAIAGYVAILGGLDLLVFTGGIGEHDPVAREKICGGMECFGLRLDPVANQRSVGSISGAGSTVQVRVVTSDEETQIARIVFGLLRSA
jgi:acetate kinase